jgi:methionyl-tRNA formyltransferase
MNKKDLRIVYMGTPDFAVESLRALVENDYNVVGVVTTPDRFIGRHMSTPIACPVKVYAESVNIPTLCPEKLKDEDFLNSLREFKADLQIVVAFRMLPEVVWNMPHLGTFNLHASLLPKYRGAAPINWAIINGEEETGVTTFFLDHEIDTGGVIAQKRIPISETDNAGTVHDKLMTIGAKLVTKTVDMIIEGKTDSIPQENLCSSLTELHHAPKIFKETCRINWDSASNNIYNFIRGLSPYPAAWSEFVSPDGTRTTMKIYDAEKRIKRHKLEVGALTLVDKNTLDVATVDGFIRLKHIQIAGKKAMPAADFLNGMLNSLKDIKEIERFHFE